jgi:hypothetical protein
MSGRTKREKRSPLKRKPLRNPGDSVQEELDDLLVGDFLAVVFAALFAVILAGWEWWRFYTSTPPQPVPLTFVAVATVAFAGYRFAHLRKRTASLKLGRDGEKAVAQYLEAHRGPDWRLFNDIPADHFNIDHVVIAPQGIFVLETKTFSKPMKESGQDAKVVYDGAKIRVDGHSPDRDPVAQARAVRDWIRDVLAETTGRHVTPRGVVVMPGWWIDHLGADLGLRSGS